MASRPAPGLPMGSGVPTVNSTSQVTVGGYPITHTGMSTCSTMGVSLPITTSAIQVPSTSGVPPLTVTQPGVPLSYQSGGVSTSAPVIGGFSTFGTSHPNSNNGQNDRISHLPHTSKLTFDGKFFRGFLEKFEAIARKHNMTDQEKLEDLKARLNDSAMEFFLLQPTEVKNSYSKLIEELSMRFDERHNPSVVRKQLITRVQCVEEGLREYAYSNWYLTHIQAPT